VLARKLAASGANVTGITLSHEQLLYCERHTSPQSSGSEIYFPQDYRSFFANNRRTYDAITSVEVLDHIGKSQFETFFRLAYDNLKDDGAFFLQLIARPSPSQTSGWIQKYIYPGGYIASLEEIEAAYVKAGFRSAGLEYIASSHYAQTLREWRTNLVNAWPGISAKSGFDGVFYRKWMFFLAYSISAFENAGFCNYHLTLKKLL